MSGAEEQDRRPRDLEALNDQLAREHDIDDYYARSSPLVRWIEGRRLALIRRLLRPRPDDRIVELGCGGGHVLRLFPEATLVGVDVSSLMLEKAARNLAGFRAELHQGDIATIELGDGRFDKVLCTEVLEHVVDPDRVLAKARRLLRPSGRAVVTFPNDGLIAGLRGVVQRTGLSRLPPFRRLSWGGDEYHLHRWSIDEMRALLSQHFVIEQEAFAPSRLLPIRCCFACAPRFGTAG